jgi:hypothetical protein
MDLATLWNFQNGPPAFSATYFCPILCRVVQSFGSNGDGPLLSAALWIQALDSREETEKKNQEIFAYQYPTNPFADHGC